MLMILSVFSVRIVLSSDSVCALSGMFSDIVFRDSLRGRPLGNLLTRRTKIACRRLHISLRFRF